MNMINKGIPYFPTPANFFDEEVMELLEAKFGVLASYMVMRLRHKQHLLYCPCDLKHTKFHRLYMHHE